LVDLSVNVDHVATLREARKVAYPDPVAAAYMAELAGARGITIHLRADRRHIQDRDLKLMRQTVRSRLNLEMAINQEIIRLALDQSPDTVTLVPERPEEVTTEGGLDVVHHKESVENTISLFEEREIEVSLFVDPDMDQIKASHDVGAKTVEINTSRYVDAPRAKDRLQEYAHVLDAVRLATKLRMTVAAGHGLDLQNVGPIAAIPGIRELNIGHSIISHAVFVGIERAVREMLTTMEKGEMLEI
jgi:pyridoxine 5-phosphate synthase